ncbi:hypothetical protein G9P44_004736 [Scheffersomyces stipitis]|nr:hypothetical protein G9P44_004736 [Scheffersomyces stipitis]
MSATNYTAVYGLMQLLRYQNNYPDLSSGSWPQAQQGRNLLGSIPPVMQQFTTDYQINLFGDYPGPSDLVPSVIFAVIFGIIALAHLFIFIMNYSRGHYFWLSLGWFIYGVMRVIGFSLRPVWGRDLSYVLYGPPCEVFLILPSILIVSFNLILAQRIFTWRHPVGGSRKLFWGVMITLYVVVAGVVAMTIVASIVPYLYFLSERVYTRYKKVVQVTSVLVSLYSLTSISLLGLAYFFKPTKKDEDLYTFQPWWIESFSPLYYVKKGAAQEAAQSFARRHSIHRRAIRVIPASHHHYRIVEGLSKERGNINHNASLLLITVTTVLIFVGCILRAIVVFQGRYRKDSSILCRPVAMYIVWGVFELFINLCYLIGRVDLRFYRPDRLPKDIRDIMTANVSQEPSLTSRESESDGFESPEENDKETYDDSEGFDFSDPEPASSVRGPYEPPKRPFQIPYPVDEKYIHKEDDEDEEFHF